VKTIDVCDVAKTVGKANIARTTAHRVRLVGLTWSIPAYEYTTRVIARGLRAGRTKKRTQDYDELNGVRIRGTSQSNKGMMMNHLTIQRLRDCLLRNSRSFEVTTCFMYSLHVVCVRMMGATCMFRFQLRSRETLLAAELCRTNPPCFRRAHMKQAICITACSKSLEFKNRWVIVAHQIELDITKLSHDLACNPFMGQTIICGSGTSLIELPIHEEGANYDLHPWIIV